MCKCARDSCAPPAEQTLAAIKNTISIFCEATYSSKLIFQVVNAALMQDTKPAGFGVRFPLYIPLEGKAGSLQLSCQPFSTAALKT